MPDLTLLSQGMGVSAGVAALVVFAWTRARRRSESDGLNSVCALALACGVVCGCMAIGLRPRWPPMNGLDRLLTIVLPATVAIEVFSGVARMPRRLILALRIALAIVMGRVLLHGSVYVSGPDPTWSSAAAATLLACYAALVSGLWWLLVKLSRRAPGASIPFALVLTIWGAGAAIMLGGYIKGGMAGLLVASALAGTVLCAKRVAEKSNFSSAVGLGVVSLAGLLFIGRFFGGLTTASALTVLFAPLCCWATEMPRFRGYPPLLVSALRLGLVAAPLAVLLILALIEFQRHTAPLL